MNEPHPWRIEASELERARAVVARHARRTPLVPADPCFGDGVFLKLETEQDTGSFKLRGALAAIDALDPAARARGILTASAGNHGYGVARAASRFGVEATVFVSRSAPAVKREGIARAGARVEEVDAAGYDEVEALAREAAAARGSTFVSPFDDPRVAAGNGGTLGLEILEALPEVGAIVAPVGGGGLVAGLAAARAHGGGSFDLIGVQSAACPAMAESFEAGRALTRFSAREPTLAEGLEGGVSPSTFAIARAMLSRLDVVPESAIAEAMRVAARVLGAPVEGSAAVGLAWALAHRDAVWRRRPTVVVVTGRNVDPEVLEALAGGGPGRPNAEG